MIGWLWGRDMRWSRRRGDHVLMPDFEAGHHGSWCLLWVYMLPSVIKILARPDKPDLSSASVYSNWRINSSYHRMLYLLISDKRSSKLCPPSPRLCHTNYTYCYPWGWHLRPIFKFLARGRGRYYVWNRTSPLFQISSTALEPGLKPEASPMLSVYRRNGVM